jgi:phage terminase large subunit-like protein
MVKDILSAQEFSGKIVEVHASNSKYARAEPVEALYGAGKVEHLDTDELKHLEEEQTSWVPLESKKSPDRLDALVYAIHYFINPDDPVAKHDKVNYNELIRRFRK